MQKLKFVILAFVLIGAVQCTGSGEPLSLTKYVDGGSAWDIAPGKRLAYVFTPT